MSTVCVCLFIVLLIVVLIDMFILYIITLFSCLLI